MTTELKIEGMSCEMCVQHVSKALLSVPGVSAAEVNLQSAHATVQHESANVPQMIEAVEEEGYTASVQ